MRRAWVPILVVLGLVLGLAGCTTGQTSEDQRDRAVRRMVQRMGVTEEVATCIVDQVEATLGLAVLEDDDPPDAVSVQINEITTDCLLVVPSGSEVPSSSGPTVPEGTTSPPVPTDPSAFTTTTGVPRP